MKIQAVLIKHDAFNYSTDIVLSIAPISSRLGTASPLAFVFSLVVEVAFVMASYFTK
ncbi:MAG: hypothetical protein ACKVOQ_14415 [Cyclobacteriaceae bacterium]